MNANYRILMRMQFYQVLGINRVLHSHDPKEKRRALGIGATALLLLTVLVVYSALLAFGLTQIGLTELLPTLAVLVASMLTIVLSFMKSSGVLIGLKDYDLVMSLPVRTFDVVASRLTMVYLVNFGVGLIAMLPTVVIYGIYARPSLTAYVMFTLALFLVPLLPMILALVLGVLITAASVRFRHRNLVTLALSAGATVGAVALSFQGSTMSMENMADLAASVGDTVNRVYPPANLLSAAVLQGDWLSFAAFAVPSLLLGGIFVALVAHVYQRLNTAVLSHAADAGPKAQQIEVSSAFQALYQREFRRYFSCTIYAMNASIGVILLLVMAVASLWMPLDVLEQEPKFASLFQSLPLVMAMMVGMSSTTACSLSLEGKNRWILHSAPLAAKTVFDAKIAVNLTVVLPITWISAGLLCIAAKASPLDALLMFLVPTVYGCFISVLGMYFNAKLPKYDWTNEIEAVKNSASVLATIGVGMGSSILPLMVSMALPQIHFALMGLLAVLLAGITVLVYRRLGKIRLFS